MALYLAHLAVTNRKSSTAERSLSAISQTHARHGLPSPCASEVVRGALKGLRRRSGAGAIARRALDATEIALMVDTLPSDLTGIRDRAILTLAFGSGLRRSEIVALDISDVAPADGDALVITVRHSKTDQEGTGRRVRVRSRNDVTCPVRAIRAWLFATRIETGALFCGILRGGHLTQRRLNDKYLERLVKRAAEEAGIPTTGLSAHSLRSGFATDQAKSGVPERTIMRRLGHTDPAMTRRYIQWAEED